MPIQRYKQMKKSISLLIIIFCSAYVFSQRSELGVFLGGSYYIGDLNPYKHFALTKPAAGLIYRYNINSRFTFKINTYYGTLQGNDAKIKFNEKRNLSFKSSIFDISTQLELNFFDYIPGDMEHCFAPYIFAGVSLFNFNPKAEYNGKWYKLKPLGTEGQGTSIPDAPNPYSLTTFAFPFGIGTKYNLTENITFGLEWGLRKTFTDYIDDVSTVYADPSTLSSENTPVSALLADRSIKDPNETVSNTGLQRGNSKTKDWYSFAGIILTFKINNKTKVCSAYNQHKVNYNKK